MANTQTLIADLQAIIQRAYQAVLGGGFYADSTGVLLTVWLADADLIRLRHLNYTGHKRGLVIRRKSACFDRVENINYPCSVTLHQPTHAALVFLASVAPRYKLYRFDLAWDLLVETQADAAKLQAILRKHITLRWHGGQLTNIYKGTDYLSKRSARRNIAIYSDKWSKMTGGLCCHVEFRLKGVDNCARFGIGRLEHVLAVDPARIVRRMARFSILDWETLEAAIEMRHLLRQAAPPRASRYLSSRYVASVRKRRVARLMNNAFNDAPQPDRLDEVPVQQWVDLGYAHPDEFKVPVRGAHKRMEIVMKGATKLHTF
jgi:hypothetical protein